MYKLTIELIIILIAITNSSAYAYIGPGMGGGIIAVVFGIIIAIFAALLGVLYYPIKRFLKKGKQKRKSNKQK